jgi:hypothetical protein
MGNGVAVEPWSGGYGVFVMGNPLAIVAPGRRGWVECWVKRFFLAFSFFLVLRLGLLPRQAWGVNTGKIRRREREGMGNILEL